MSCDDLALSVRGVSKAYTISHGEDHSTLVEAALHRLRHPLGRMQRERFVALDHVSFDVRQGEVVGLIGRNGAGKSTLLKIISRITEPTAGRIDLYGRVGSLLEVGTGFHRELTGRENVYLNGSILGMSRREIRRQFDEIVAFAGVEKFLDTPVKRYSSGMYVRLAFAVAAHLRTDILIVDEVLAVGDSAFQSKCLDKMRDVTRQGRTVLFVSHNMGTLQALCGRALLLRQGKAIFDGDAEEAVRIYLASLEAEGGLATPVEERPGTGEVEMTDVRLLDSSGQPATSVMGGEDATLEIDYRSRSMHRHPKLIANLYDARGRAVASFSTALTAPHLGELGPRGRFTCRLPRLALVPGRYRIALALHADGIVTDTLKSAVTFDVTATVFYDTGAAPTAEQAVFLIDHQWEHEPLAPLRQPAGADAAPAPGG